MPVAEAGGQTGEEAGAEGVADTGGSARRTSRATLISMGSSPRVAMTAPSLPRVITRVVTRSAISSCDQPVFCEVRAASYSLVSR